MDSIIVILLVGLVAGFAASHLVAGHGFGIVGDLVVGVLGSLVGYFLAGVVGIVATGVMAQVVIAFIGAAFLIAVLRLVGTRTGLGARRKTVV